MEGDYDNAHGGPFTPLQQFVMELFRVISPNGGSISSLQQLGMREPERHGYAITPHLAVSTDPRHWENPLEFDPERYKSAPASDQIGKERARAIGFARCPFEKASFPVKDGRNADMTNSAFGTVFGVVDGKPHPVCDYAGFTPFGFGYRRCPGELLTIAVFEDFLKKVWAQKIEFRKLDVPNPARLPVGPTTVIDDNIGFVRRS
jgi:cytochrome P450